MAKQSIFGRVAQLAKANINALLDQAEDPEKMLDQMVRDYSASISEAEAAVAQTIGNLRLMQQDNKAARDSAAGWGNKALAASRKADEFRTSGHAGDASKFDNLAKIAIQRQIASENEAKSTEPTIASQEEIVERLKDGLMQMKTKLGELDGKRHELAARKRTAAAQNQMHEAMKSIGSMDASSEIGRLEAKVRRDEARAIGNNELAASSLDAQFDALEDLGEVSEVEARLAAMKANAAITS